MWIPLARQALASGRRLEVRYDGFTRVVEVHAIGYTKDDNIVLRVWQVSGGSQSGERSGWKLMRADEAGSANVLDEPSLAPRIGYKRGDKAMTSIIAEI